MDKTQSTSQTILFADIAGSTRLYEKLGDKLARNMVAACFEIMNAVVRAYQGHMVKTIGDGVMGCFASPDAATHAAVGMQEAVSTDGRLAPENVRLHIGFHHGPVIEADNDLYGDAVNVAARMAAQAKAGQIITSRHTLGMLDPKLCATARMVDHARVKGKSDLIEIFEIAWGQPEELTMMGTLTNEMVNTAARQRVLMTLDLQDQHVSIDHEHPAVTLGRDQSNRLVVDNPKVSRLHARVEVRKDKFILIDRSTNGTYVYPEGQEMLLLHRDEVTLDGEGFFSLGQAVNPDSPLAIRYLGL